MNGASKILTVSYGTFSCTLEGFNDPFNTMKAIAEYFRDLAADDRYFGAEPPTPDAAMLHRIAEREIQRRVETKIQDNGVILRVGTGPMSDASGPPRAELATPQAPHTTSPAPETAASIAAPAMSESVAAKLMRIRNAVAQSQPAAAMGAMEDDSGYAEDQDAASAPVPDVQAQEPLIATPPPTETSSQQDSLPEDDAAQPETLLTAEDHLPEDAAIAEPAEEEAAAVADTADQTTDDTQAEDHLPEEDLTAEEDLADLATLDAPHQSDSDREDAQASLPEPLPEPAPGTSAQDIPDLDEDDEALLADVAPAAQTVPDDRHTAAEAEAAFASDQDLSGTEAANIAAVIAAENSVEEPVVEPTIADKAARARARVIKIRRPGPGEAVPAAAAALSAEAEADLLRELAEVESQVPATTRQELLENRKRLEGGAGDAAVSRLIGQTNTEMAQPENRRRHAAISHLKAAVVATQAERLSGGTGAPPETDRIDPYRSDLSRLVRPATLALAADRPAPLVLVSEQRIDRKPAAPAQISQPAAESGKTMVRPRRISAASNLALQDELIDDDENDDENIFTDGKGFAEFATRLGAQELPALIEAAAAYSACVEGRPHFSRPQLIRQISAMAPEGGFNREDGMRSFGTLLRAGKVAKIKRGQFALTESSQFLAAARKLLD